jgi:hypothetical protein
MNEKKQLITDILQVCAVSDCFGMDVIFINLCCLEVPELKKIAQELYIKV